MQVTIMWSVEPCEYISAEHDQRLAYDAEFGWQLTTHGGVDSMFLRREEALDLAFDPANGFRSSTPGEAVSFRWASWQLSLAALS